MSFDADLKHITSIPGLTNDERVVRMCVAGHSGEILRRIRSAPPEEQQRRDVPPAVRMAIRVLLNHVEPGWENCATVVQAWLNDAPSQPQKNGQS